MINLNEIDFSQHAATAVKAHKVALDKFLKDNKDEIKALTKEEQKEEDARLDAFKKPYVVGLGVGRIITFSFKGEEVQGLITKITDKTFSVTNEELGIENKWRFFRWAVIESGWKPIR